MKKIQDIKTEELGWLRQDFGVGTDYLMLNDSIPPLFLFVTFGTYLLFYGMFSVSFVFTVIKIYDIFKAEFSRFPFIIGWLFDTIITGERLTLFLLSDHLDTSYIKKVKDGDDQSPYSIEISGGNFFWEDPDLRKCYQAEKDRIAKKDTKIEFSETELEMIRLRSKITNEGYGVDFVDPEAPTLVNQNARSLMEQGDVQSQLKQDFGESLLNNDLLMSEDLYQGITFNLKDINLKIRKGACVGIIGSVGSGKSSLLSSLSGEMYQRLGTKIKLVGSTAYVSQRAWIPSMTVKESILFGEEYHEKRYQDSIKYSCMTSDLEILANRDDTLLGEKGINLSGGQKIRLSIARAMYSDSDIYLFDDPISALDVHVGKSVMEEGIIGYLKGKTRVIATHAIEYLKYFDYVYIIDEGKIIEEGDYDTISKTQLFLKMKQAEEAKKVEEQDHQEQNNLIVEDTVNSGAQKKETETEKENTTKGKKKKSKKKRKNQKSPFKVNKKKNQQLDEEPIQSLVKNESNTDKQQRKLIDNIIESEDRAKGLISLKILKNWINLTGGYLINSIILLSMIPWSVMVAGVPWFLQKYASQSGSLRHKNRWKQMIIFSWPFLAIVTIRQLLLYFRLKYIFSQSIRMSTELNFKMTFQTIHASVNKFFDRIPVGRLLNRFLKDVATLDQRFPWSMIGIYDMT